MRYTMDNLDFFNKHILHDHRVDFTATVDIRYSSKPGFELIGHGQENEGFGYRHYILEDGDCYVIRDNQTRAKWHDDDITSVTESSLFENYHGLMARYFGTVLVHIALLRHAKITVKFTSDIEYKAKTLPPDFVREFAYLGKGRGRNKVFTTETIYDNSLLQKLSPPEKKAVVVLTDSAKDVLNTLPHKLSEIMDDNDVDGAFEYTSAYVGKNYTRKMYF